VVTSSEHHPGDRTSLLSRQAEIVGDIVPGEEKAPGRAY